MAIAMEKRVGTSLISLPVGCLLVIQLSIPHTRSETFTPNRRSRTQGQMADVQYIRLIEQYSSQINLIGKFFTSNLASNSNAQARSHYPQRLQMSVVGRYNTNTTHPVQAPRSRMQRMLVQPSRDRSQPRWRSSRPSAPTCRPGSR